MATLVNAGGGNFTLTPTARETTAVQRAATQAGMPALAFMEAKITAWIRDLRGKHDELDAAARQVRYDAVAPSVQAQIDALLPPLL